MCDHHLDDGPLVCTREGDHPDHPRGHVYESTSGIKSAPKEEA